MEKTVHFAIDGEGFTELIRNIWAEGRPAKAFEIVRDGLGMGESLFLQIVDGKRKLVNNEEDAGSLFLEEDNAKSISLPRITKDICDEYGMVFEEFIHLEYNFD